jgi:hypothetical protein
MAMNAAGSKKARSVYLGRALFWSFVILVISGVLAFQYRERIALRKEIDVLQARREQAAHLLADNRSLAAQQPSAAELTLLRSDREAIAKLRNEVETLRKTVEKNVRPPGAPADKKSVPTMLDAMVPASAWRNVGHATPEAAVETALWAAAGGEVELLARSLILDTKAREKAAAILSGLPAETRMYYGTPELLMAFLTAKDIPSKGARILKPSSEALQKGTRTVQLRDAGGLVRQAHLTLRETAAGWRLVLPEEAVTGYAAMLKE